MSSQTDEHRDDFDSLACPVCRRPGMIEARVRMEWLSGTGPLRWVHIDCLPRESGPLPSEAALISEAVRVAFDVADIGQWWDTHMGELGGQTPREAWNSAGREAVWGLVSSYVHTTPCLRGQ